LTSFTDSLGLWPELKLGFEVNHVCAFYVDAEVDSQGNGTLHTYLGNKSIEDVVFKRNMVAIDKINPQRLQSLHELHEHSMSILTYDTQMVNFILQFGNLHLQQQQKNPIKKKKNNKTSFKPWNNIRSKQRCPNLQNSFENIWK